MNERDALRRAAGDEQQTKKCVGRFELNTQKLRPVCPALLPVRASRARRRVASSSCLLTLIVVQTWVVETKGLSLEELERIYSSRRNQQNSCLPCAKKRSSNAVDARQPLLPVGEQDTD